MNYQGSEDLSVGAAGAVPGATYDPFKFRVLNAVIRLLVVAYTLIGITYLAMISVTYQSNDYMDIRAITATCFLAASQPSLCSSTIQLYINNWISNTFSPQFSWSCATNFFETIFLLRRRGSKSWSLVVDLASICSSAVACIYVAVMRAAYLRSLLDIHDNGNKHLLDTLHTVSVITVILAVVHIPTLALTIISYYRCRRTNGVPPEAILGQRFGDLPLVDYPQHGRPGRGPGREGAVTPERRIVFPDDSPVAGPSSAL